MANHKGTLPTIFALPLPVHVLTAFKRTGRTVFYLITHVHVHVLTLSRHGIHLYSNTRHIMLPPRTIQSIRGIVSE